MGSAHELPGRRSHGWDEDEDEDAVWGERCWAAALCERGRRRRPPRLRSNRPGLTLLELLLALALTSLVLAAISMAVELSLRTLDVRRTDVEEAQLAQALLQIMARDLRSVVLKPADDSAVLASVAAMETGEAADASGKTEEPGATEDVVGEDEVSAESENVQGIADSTTLPPTLGLYGNQYELQLDISHLPRVEQYQQSLTADPTALADIPSDVKTVAYYLAAPGTEAVALGGAIGASDSQLGLGADELQAGGLMRRELDRAVSLWASESGNLNGLESQGELIGPEVAALEFRYFDGLEWQTEWDTEQMGGLPLAVEIVMTLRPAISVESENDPSAAALSQGQSPGGDLVYRLVVPLPLAKCTNGQTELLEELGL